MDTELIRRAEQARKTQKIPVNWTCPKCGNDHRWSWDVFDVGTAFGRITMDCEKCQTGTPCILGKNGQVRVLVQQAQTGEARP